VSGDGGVGTYLASSPILPLLIPTPLPLPPPPWLPSRGCETVPRCGHHIGDSSGEAEVGCDRGGGGMPQWCRWAGVVWARRNDDIVVAVVVAVARVRNRRGTHLLVTEERGRAVGLPGVVGWVGCARVGFGGGLGWAGRAMGVMGMG
jgi:hypothetical protein